ncbi:MAG: NFACT family protein [Firmicutes bacterium]|nr:NFACT family protein [Bacillota bacterium]
MPYDAGMLAAVCREVRGATGARCEKIYASGREEVTILLRGSGETKRLYINVGASTPRMCFIKSAAENPETPPSFCMLLRKHLSGALLTGCRQFGAERAAALTFETRDEMGFPCEKSLIVEIMNKYSNLILCHKDGKIIGASRVVDFTTSRMRQVLPGMIYELPPAQNKTDITALTKDELYRMAAAADDMPADKFIIKSYTGISPLISREAALFASGGSTDAPVSECSGDRLWQALSALQTLLSDGEPCRPTVVYDESGKPLEFSCFDILEYGNATKKHFDTPSLAVEEFFAERGRIERVASRGHDIGRALSSAKRRLQRKISILEEELLRTKDGEHYKRMGDIISANLYMLKRGMTEAELIDYYDENLPTVKVTLDGRMSPTENAQHFYKLCAKCKRSSVVTAEQLELAKSELAYIETVEDALDRASGETEISEIRRELTLSGYLKSKGSDKHGGKRQKISPYLTYMTSGGYSVLCGKNNLQNDELTKSASGGDIWFHVKGSAGSHTVMLCDAGDEPPAEDYTEAAMIAAYNSSLRGGSSVPVDYTRAKNVKKPSGSHPGFVIYHTNFTAYVTPDGERVNSMLVKK